MDMKLTPCRPDEPFTTEEEDVLTDDQIQQLLLEAETRLRGGESSSSKDSENVITLGIDSTAQDLRYDVLHVRGSPSGS